MFMLLKNKVRSDAGVDMPRCICPVVGRVVYAPGHAGELNRAGLVDHDGHAALTRRGADPKNDRLNSRGEESAWDARVDFDHSWRARGGSRVYQIRVIASDGQICGGQSGTQAGGED